MEKEEVEKEVKRIIVEKLMVDPQEVTAEADFEEDLGGDSLDAVEIIMEIEERFGITIPDEEAEKVKTVNDAVNLIEKLLQEKEKTKA